MTQRSFFLFRATWCDLSVITRSSIGEPFRNSRFISLANAIEADGKTWMEKYIHVKLTKATDRGLRKFSRGRECHKSFGPLTKKFGFHLFLPSVATWVQILLYWNFQFLLYFNEASHDSYPHNSIFLYVYIHTNILTKLRIERWIILYVWR